MARGLRPTLVAFYGAWFAATLLLLLGAVWAVAVYFRGCTPSPERRLQGAHAPPDNEYSVATAREFTRRIAALVGPALVSVLVIASGICVAIAAHIYGVAFNLHYMANMDARLQWFVGGARTLIASLTVVTGTVGSIPAVVETALEASCFIESTAASAMIVVGSLLVQLGCYGEPCLWKDRLEEGYRVPGLLRVNRS